MVKYVEFAKQELVDAFVSILNHPDLNLITLIKMDKLYEELLKEIGYFAKHFNIFKVKLEKGEITREEFEIELDRVAETESSISPSLSIDMFDKVNPKLDYKQFRSIKPFLMLE